MESTLPARPTTRSRSFGSVAAEYDRYRPSYAQDAISRLAQIIRGGKLVEVGAGTGIATRQLIAKGMVPLCIEPDSDMLDVLRERGGDLEIPTFCGTFEEWADSVGALGTWDAIVSAEAWHWTDPDKAHVLAGKVLREGGVLSTLTNELASDVPWDRRLVEEVYEEFGLAGERPAETHTRDTPESDSWGSCFSGPASETFHWVSESQTSHLVMMLSTTSAVTSLGSSGREDYIHRMLEVLKPWSSEPLHLTMATRVDWAIRL